MDQDLPGPPDRLRHFCHLQHIGRAVLVELHRFHVRRLPPRSDPLRWPAPIRCPGLRQPPATARCARFIPRLAQLPDCPYRTAAQRDPITVATLPSFRADCPACGLITLAAQTYPLGDLLRQSGRRPNRPHRRLPARPHASVGRGRGPFPCSPSRPAHAPPARAPPARAPPAVRSPRPH